MLNVNGGDEKTRFSISGSIFNQDGIIKGSTYDRYSFRSNLDHHFSKKFSAVISSTLTHLNTQRKDSGGGARGNTLISSQFAPPTLTPYNDDGTYRVLATVYPFVAPDVLNPLNFLNEQSSVIKANIALVNAALIFNPIEELTLKISGGIENRDDRTDAYTTRKFINSDGRASASTGQFTSLLNENTISYVKSINNKHNISAVTGFTFQNFISTSLSGSGVGFLSDVFETYDLSAAITPGIPGSGYSKNVAEAKFLRAFTYFQLVRNWGNIPLRTEESMTERDLAKSPVSAVYDLIIADLINAEGNLPETQTLAGRPTKYSAITMLADVYLTLGRYAEARDKADEVIQSNKYSLVPVNNKTDFQLNLFGPTIITTPEEIFYFKYSRQAGQGNWILWVVSHSQTGGFNFGGAYAHYSNATNPFYIAWNDNDIRKSLWVKINFGLGYNTLVSTKYVDPNAVEQSRGAGNDLPVYRYADALLIYAEASCMASTGPTTAGIEALNKVHRRAYGEDVNTPSDIDYKITDYNKNTFQDLVLRERAYEFIFEGKRWYDLKRTGTAADVIIAAKGITIAEKAYLWPIPVSEMNFNKALDPAVDQNPGY